MSVTTLIQPSQVSSPRGKFADYPTRERAFLIWFVRFAATGTMEAHIIDGEIYYWVRHEYAYKKLPQFFPSPRSVMWTLSKLSGKARSQVGGKERLVQDPTGNHPLEHRIIWTRGGKKSLYRLREEPMKKLFQVDGVKSFKQEKPQKRLLSPEVQEILKMALSIPMKGDPTKMLFTNQWSGDSRMYTNTIRQAAEYLNELYEGRFLRSKLGLLPDWYVKKYAIDRDEISARVLSVKGDWVKVAELVKTAIRNFRFSYEPDRLPREKEKLTKSFTDFLCYPVADGIVSSFLSCALRKAELITEPLADAVYQSLPEEIRDVAHPLFADECLNFDASALRFWSSILDVYQWGVQYKKECSRLSGANYWLSGGLPRWLAGYIDWLQEWCPGGIQVGNLGVGNKTWAVFLNTKIKEHELDRDATLRWDRGRL